MTRIGKIARLPLAVRDELNCRLLDGEPNQQLVAWLNSRDDVRAILATHFGGREVTEQNLSDWKLGGYEDWVDLQAARKWVDRLAERSRALAGEAGQASVADWLSAPLTFAIGRAIEKVAISALHNPDDCQCLIALTREINQLRRGDHEQELLRLQRERWAATPKPPESSLIKANPA